MMQAFESLSVRGQARRLRRLAMSALAQYDLADVSVRLLQHVENTTYQIDQPHTRQRFLLRLHGEGYQTAATIRSECLWLKALQHEAKLVVPDPVLTPDGQFCLSLHVPGVPTSRLCSLLRWISGRRYHRQLQPHHLTQLAALRLVCIGRRGIGTSLQDLCAAVGIGRVYSVRMAALACHRVRRGR